MKLARRMLVGSVLSAIVASTLFAEGVRLEIWLGMLGPLAAALVSWVAMERQYRKGVERLTGVMIRAFTVKMVFFGIYITIVLRSGWVRPIPFAICFICYFLALHITEAIALRRLHPARFTFPPAALNG